jgi:hypothetical protein
LEQVKTFSNINRRTLIVVKILLYASGELLKVVRYNSEKIDRRKQVRLDVYFTAVSLIDIPGEKELIEMMQEIQSAKSA